MSDNLKDAVPQILAKIPHDLATFRQSVEKRLDQVETRIGQVDTRLAQIDDVLRKQRRDTAGLLVMAKALSGEFAEELAAVEARVEKLEAEIH